MFVFNFLIFFFEGHGCSKTCFFSFSCLNTPYMDFQTSKFREITTKTPDPHDSSKTLELKP